MIVGPIRPYLAFALCLLMGLTSQSLAVARVSTGPAGQVTLCTGTGPVMVYVDENGAPTGPPHFCPEAALSLIMAVAAPEAAVQWMGRETRMSGRTGAVAIIKYHSIISRARDPPDLV